MPEHGAYTHIISLKICIGDCKFRLQFHELYRQTAKHGRDQFTRPSREHGHPCYQQLPEQGIVSDKKYIAKVTLA
jgi:hypothetical protein